MTERIVWLEPASRLTQRLRAWLEALLQLLPISHVSRLTGLHWHTLKQLDNVGWMPPLAPSSRVMCAAW